MRAYVITGEDTGTGDAGDHNVAVTSSKRLAVDACESFLNDIDTGDKITWSLKEKHFGMAAKGEFVVTYRMFFVNQVELDE